MNIRLFVARIILVIEFTVGCSSFSILEAQHTRSEMPMVIVLGIDGLSLDGLQTASTPNIDQLIHNGALSLKARGVMPTVSAPNWTSMLTAAGPEQHGVTKNGWTRENATIQPTAKDADGFFPSIFSTLREQQPNAIIAGFYDWEDLGNFFSWKNADTVVRVKADDMVQYIAGDIATYRAAISYIIARKPNLTFLYAGSVDEVGHELGHGTEAYYKSISRVDSLIGELLRSLKNAGLYEKTNFILIADHGGVGFGHGGESMDEIQVPWLISGPGIIFNRMIEEPVNSMQTASTIGYLFHLKPPREWIALPVVGAFAANTEAASRNKDSYVPKPTCSVKTGIYTEPQGLFFTTKDPSAITRYTNDGTEPNDKSPVFLAPIHVSKSTLFKAKAFHGNAHSSTAVVNIVIIDGVKSIVLKHQPHARYAGEGPLGLLDGNYGVNNYKDKSWMGFEGDDLEATIDFGNQREVRQVTVEVLQNNSAWIFLPSAIELSSSDDGNNFSWIGKRSRSDFNVGDTTGIVKIMKECHSVKARYLKIKTLNIGTCPNGHSGAGQKAWLFVDEITIE